MSAPIQIPNPVSPAGVWANRITKVTLQNANEDNYRTLDDKTEPFQLSAPTLYDKDKHYSPGDLAFVKEVIFITDHPTLASGTYIPMGMWVCVKMVPSNEYDSVNGYEYKRSDDINYYPTWPLPENEDDIYWFPFCGFVEMTICPEDSPYLVAASKTVDE